MLEPAAARASSDRESKWGRRIALASVVLGLLLSISKLWVGYLAHSAAVISDGLESGGDVFSSAMVYVGLLLARKPPDQEHPYGHGRYETLAGLGVGAMLLLMGAGILWSGLTRAEEPRPLPAFAIYPLLASLIVKSSMAGAKILVGRRIKSLALEADALHDVTDLLSSGVALLSVALVLFDPARFASADRVGGIIIGVIVSFLSVSMVRRVVDQLLDTMPEPEHMEEIRAAALGVPGALGIEKCFARRSGMRYHVDLHLEVAPELSVRASHDIAASVRMQVRDRLPWVADVLVHVEPSQMLPQQGGLEIAPEEERASRGHLIRR